MRHLRTSLLLLSFASLTQGRAQHDPVQSKGYALFAADGKFTPYTFERHAVGDNDVLIEILYTGICHSDIHHAHEDWKKETYPMVPGHEVAGRVTQVGSKVTKFKVGDLAGVGCLVDTGFDFEHPFIPIPMTIASTTQ